MPICLAKKWRQTLFNIPFSKKTPVFLQCTPKTRISVIIYPIQIVKLPSLTCIFFRILAHCVKIYYKCTTWRCAVKMEKNLNLHVHGSSSSSFSCCAVNAAALKMPFLGIGTFEGFDPDSKSLTTSEAVSLALEVGYRHIDCAFAHNNEVEIGKAISYGLENLNIPR